MARRLILPFVPIFIMLLALTACDTASPDGGSASSSTSMTSSVQSSDASLGASEGAYVAAGCKLSGCSAQYCLEADDEDMASTCEFRPEYECYKSARCEKQTTGSCGWTLTPSLTACLQNTQ